MTRNNKVKKKQKCFNFKDQKKKGQKGENRFLEYYHEENARLSPIFDFDIMIRDNERVELKTDSYKSPRNFFMERYGNVEKLKDGGPWQSKDVDYFVYYFIKENTFFWFNPVQLCKYIDKNIKNFKSHRIYNPGYFSLGYLVPIEEISHLVLRKDVF